MKHAKLLKSLIIVAPVLALASPLIILSNTGCGNPQIEGYSPDGSDWVGRTGGTLEYSIDTNNHTYTITGNDDFTADDTFTIPQSVVIDNVRYLVTTIDGFSFFACWGLTSVNLGGVTTIGDFAFANCIELTKVNLASVTSIDDNAFLACPLEEISVNLENSAYKLVGSSTGGFIQRINDSNTTLTPACGTEGGIACGNITFVGGVTTIDDKSFSGCVGLTKIDFGSVTTIGDNAFRDCTGLGEVDLTSVINLGRDWCYICPNLSSVIIGTQTYNTTDDGWDSVGPATDCILYAPNETVADAFKTDVITDEYADKWTYQEI